MKVSAVHPAARYMGLPTRKRSKPGARQKSRSRERKTAATATKRTVRKGAATPREWSFAELLAAAPGGTRAMPHRPLPAPAASRMEVRRNRSQLTPAARRIIALGAEARGESLASADIEAQLKRERDKACGIDPVARAIIDRAENRA